MRGRHRLISALGAIMLIQSMVAGSSMELEADGLYSAAESYLKAASYQNALDSAWLAREKYDELGIAGGVEKCDKLIGQVESSLTSEQLADLYYGIAGSYYLQADTNDQHDVHVLDRVIAMASRAKELYARVGAPDGTAGALRCDNLVSKAGKMKDDDFRKCVTDADVMLRSSKESFLLEYLMVAKNLAVNASSKYAECPYPAGVDKAAELLTSINSQMNNVTVQAKTSYDLALEEAAKGDNKSCIHYANISQSLYNEVGDAGMSSQSIRVMSGCMSNMQDWEASTKKQAEAYFGDAQDYLIKSDCGEAIDQANRAKGLYQQLIDASNEAEKNLPNSQQVKTNQYSFQMGKVEGLLDGIRQKCMFINNRETAEKLYKDAQTYYLNLDAVRAKSIAAEARDIFGGLGDYVGVAKCNALIDEIDQLAASLSEAEGYMEKAAAESGVASFDGALIDAGRAKELYAGIRDTVDTKRADDFIAKTRGDVDRLSEADGYLKKARNYMQAGSYDEAYSQSKKANEVYISLNYSVGIDDSDKLVRGSADLIKRRDEDFRRNALLAGAIIALSASLFMVYKRRRRAVESEYRKKMADERENARRREDELSIRGESDVKSKVDEELRRMIEVERSKVERG